MRVLPILFNTDMVRAILEGRKSCTRRIIKPQPTDEKRFPLGICTDGDKGEIGKFAFGSYECGGEMLFCKPPYQSGDILYVRETWEHIECHCCEGDEHGNCFQEPQKSVLCKSYGCYVYRATSEISGDARWHPSIHMPKEAARIWLKVTDVRVERLQNITETQAQAEGCDSGLLTGACTARGQFEYLWNSTIKKSDLDRYGWNASPWVWVIEFERCEKPEEMKK